MSHPVWVRGLKHNPIHDHLSQSHVAPRVGAWIETTVRVTPTFVARSHPVWVRGLKP